MPSSDDLQFIFGLQFLQVLFLKFSKVLRSFFCLQVYSFFLYSGSRIFLSSSCNCRKVNVMFALSK